MTPKRAGERRGERRVERVLLHTLVLLTLFAVVAAALGGCVEKKGPTGECQRTEDCASGQICGEDGLCYGDPPALALAAELYPPEDRADLPRTEVTALAISAEGQLVLAFARPVEVAGRVVLADDADVSVAAKVVFRRRSRIPGVPSYVVTADSQPGRIGTDASFRVRLAPNEPGEVYEVTVYPDDGAIHQPQNGWPTPAELAPPLREPSVLVAEDLPGVTFTLAKPGGLKQITGRVVDAAQKGVEGLRVRAYGRFTPDAAPEILSSRGKTDAHGRFSVWVPVAAEDDFDLVITPKPGDPLPHITRRGIHVEDPPGEWTVTKDIGDLALPAYPKPTAFELPVFGSSPGGGMAPAVGAVVTFRTELDANDATTVTYVAQALVDPDGYARVLLIPGGESNRQYGYDAVPPPGTPYGAAWGRPLDVGPTGGVLGATEPLPARLYITGRVMESLGIPAAGVTIRAEPSPIFTYALDARAREILVGVAWPETVSDPEGRFALFVDPLVLGALVTYDFELVPPQGSLLPRWSLDGLPADAKGTTMALGELWLPDASYARGPVTDASGAPVPGAEVRVYEVATDTTICALAQDPSACVLPARLRALAESDGSGRVKLVLPDP